MLTVKLWIFSVNRYIVDLQCSPLYYGFSALTVILWIFSVNRYIVDFQCSPLYCEFSVLTGIFFGIFIEILYQFYFGGNIRYCLKYALCMAILFLIFSER